VVAAVAERRLDVDHGVAGEHAAVIASRMPFSIEGMNSFGMIPPTMPFSNTKPVPRSPGSRSITTWPYWPWPPVWRTKRPSTFWAVRVMVSR
jgi:hypothetical protein